MSLSYYTSHRKLLPLTLMGATLFRDQDLWVTPNANFQTRNQVAKISTGHFKKPGRECRLWHASRFASFSRLTRCQEGELISSQDARPEQNKDFNSFQDSSRSAIQLHLLKFFTQSSWDRSVMHHGTRVMILMAVAVILTRISCAF